MIPKHGYVLKSLEELSENKLVSFKWYLTEPVNLGVSFVKDPQVIDSNATTQNLSIQDNGSQSGMILFPRRYEQCLEIFDCQN